MPPEQAKELHARVDAFREALDSGKPTEPLVLDSDDINVLIADNPDLRDKVHVDLEGDKVKGQVSFPLEGIGLPAFKGRYLNGKATLKVSLEDGFLRVTLDALEVKGKPVPATFIDQLRTKNLAEDVSRNPENAEAIRKLESIQVEDGKVIIKARAREDAETKEGNGGKTTPRPKTTPCPMPRPRTRPNPTMASSARRTPRGQNSRTRGATPSTASPSSARNGWTASTASRRTGRGSSRSGPWAARPTAAGCSSMPPTRGT